MKHDINQLYLPAKLIVVRKHPEYAPDGGRIYLDDPGYPDEYRLTFLLCAQKAAPKLKPQLLAAGDDPYKLVKWQQDFHLVDLWVQRLLYDDGVRAATVEQIDALWNFMEESKLNAPFDEVGEPMDGADAWTKEYCQTVEREHSDAWYYLCCVGFDTPKRLRLDFTFTPFERLGDFKQRARAKLDEAIDALWAEVLTDGRQRAMEKARYKRRMRGRRATPYEHYDDLVNFQVLGMTKTEVAGGSVSDDGARRNASRNIQELSKLLGLTLRPKSEELENMILQRPARRDSGK